MDCEAGTCNILEQMLTDVNKMPTDLPLSLLKDITKNFSEDLEIGSGGFAVVYQGLLRNGSVAVKRLFRQVYMDEDFNKEVHSLMTVKHKNIVRFLGYCADTQGKVMKYDGKIVTTDIRHRILCFEFLPKGGLDKYITDSSPGLEWSTWYQIIKGICEGLHYLHQQRIVHRDLKPANILLDYNMVPKIADFGLSKCFSEKQTRDFTENVVGSYGYMAPEFLSGESTIKSDVYSLGIIIAEIMTGKKGYFQIENVLESWSSRLQTSHRGKWLEQVRVCADIGLKCMDTDPVKRPTTENILQMLSELECEYGFIETHLSTVDIAYTISKGPGETRSSAWTPLEELYFSAESMNTSAAPSPIQRVISKPKEIREGSTEKLRSLGSTEISKLLDVYPQELRFASVPNQDNQCPVSLTNRTDKHVGIWMRHMTPEGGPMPVRIGSFTNSTISRGDVWQRNMLIVVKPHSTMVLAATLDEPELQDIAKLEVLMVVVGSVEALGSLKPFIGDAVDIGSMFWWTVHELGGEVHRATLTAFVCAEPAAVTRRRQFIPATTELGAISCMDVHPTKTWILVGHFSKYVSIWNYETQKKVTAFVRKPFVECNDALFIAREEWVAIGDDAGWIRVYDYNTKGKVKEFKPYRSSGVIELVVHPSETFLLTASHEDTQIKLWDWSKGWKCNKTFDTGRTVQRLLLNPTDPNSFASLSASTGGNSYWPGESALPILKIWRIDSAKHISTLSVPEEVEFLYSDGNPHVLVTRDNHNRAAEIRDWRTGELVHTCDMSCPPRGAMSTIDFASHATLPIFITELYDDDDQPSQLCLWNANTYRLMKRFQLPKPMNFCLMFFVGTKDTTRLLVGTRERVSIFEINLLELLTSGEN